MGGENSGRGEGYLHLAGTIGRCGTVKPDYAAEGFVDGNPNPKKLEKRQKGTVEQARRFSRKA